MRLPLLAAAAAFAQLSFAAPPQIAFNAPRFDVTVTPGATVAYIYAAGPGKNGGGTLTDTDGDGKIGIDIGLAALPSDHGIVVADVATGEFASASYAKMAEISQRSILPGPGGAYTEFTTTRRETLALWIRPGGGAWSPNGFVAPDADGSSTNMLIVSSTTSFQPVGTSPARPNGFADGDRFFLIGTKDSQPQGGIVDARLDDPPHPGVVTFYDETRAPVIEGSDLVFHVIRLLGSQGTLTVTCQIGGSAIHNVDYTKPADTQVTFGPGELVKRVIVTTADDAVWTRPFSRSVEAQLSSSVNGTVFSPGRQGASIQDNDPAPVASIGLPATVTETDGPQSFTATISIANAHRGPLTVHWSFGPGGPSNQYLVQPGDAPREVTVTVPGDDRLDEDRTMSLGVTINETGQTVSHAIRVIEDELAVLDIADGAGQEGTFVFLHGSTLSTVRRFKWKTVDGTAKAGSDYRPAAGTQADSILLRFLDDSENEGDEVFYVELFDVEKLDAKRTRIAVTIVDDDGAPPVFSNMSAPEGTGGGYRQVFARLTRRQSRAQLRRGRR